MYMEASLSNVHVNLIPCPANLALIKELACAYAPPHVAHHHTPYSSILSMVGLYEFDHCVVLCQSGKKSSSMFELANVFVAMFETVTPILEPTTDEPTTKVRSHLLFIPFSNILVFEITSKN